MKKNKLKLLTLSALVFLFTITAVAKNQQVKTTEVEAAVEKLRISILGVDSISLTKLTAENLTYGHSGGVVEDKQTLIHAFVSGKYKFVTLDFIDETVSINGNVAIVRNTLIGTSHDAGKEKASHRLKVLMVWQKQKGQWRLLARQAVRI